MQNDKNLYIIVFVVSVVGCGLIFFTGKSGTESENAKVTFGQVDQLRKETQVKNKIERNKVQVENYRQAPALSNTYRPVAEDAQGGGSGALVLESTPNHAAIDAEVGSQSAGPLNMLENQINKRLLNDQRAAQMSALQKQQFIEDYKKRALAMGYQVELNDQLVVTKVTKVPDSQKQLKGPASIPVDVDVNEEDSEGDAGAE